MCKTPIINKVLPSTFIPCQYKITYIWLNDNTGIWAKPTHLSDDFINCWVWNSTSWTFAQVPLLKVESFICK